MPFNAFCHVCVRRRADVERERVAGALHRRRGRPQQAVARVLVLGRRAARGAQGACAPLDSGGDPEWVTAASGEALHRSWIFRVEAPPHDKNKGGGRRAKPSQRGQQRRPLTLEQGDYSMTVTTFDPDHRFATKESRDLFFLFSFFLFSIFCFVLLQ